MGIRTIIIALVAVLAIGSAGTAYYFYNQYQEAQKKINNPNEAAKEETQRLIDQMSNLIQLPDADLANGEPTLATVLDKEKLKDQEFFSKAENGDKLLIYAKAKKAFLYRPSTGKIVNVGPVSIGENQQARIALRNGTTTQNLATQVGDEIKAAYPTATIVSTENAQRTNHQQTIVVDLSGNGLDAANQIAEAIDGTVGQLPDGEPRPDNADILVIVGSDQQ